MQTVTGLQYSCCNEDTSSELEALDLRGRRALSIHASGGRAFGLLLGDPSEVVAIDRNPAQIHLGRLKVAAMRRLDRDAYLGFVGMREGSARADVYRSVRGELPDDARAFWDDRPADIAEGIQHVGRTERSIARVSPVLRRFLNAAVVRMRSASSLEEQGEIARAVFDRPAVRAVLALIFNPLSGRFILRDPVYYGEGRRRAADYLRERVVSTMQRHRFDDCFILSLFLHGNLKHSRAMPVGLGADEYPIIQSRLDRIRFEQSCVIDYLGAQPAEQFDAFSLSDLGGYLTIAEFGQLLQHVERVSRRGATVCIREYISAPTARAAWPNGLSRDPELARRLDVSDRSIGCTFVCATKTAPSTSSGG
jgi:S-adenosylmethionine-diacylglycerol 3-amino-3-carboxypropyl transferase